MVKFITGSLEDVKKNVDIAKLDDEYKNVTEIHLISPPLQCNYQLNIVKCLCTTGSDIHMLKNISKS